MDGGPGGGALLTGLYVHVPFCEHHCDYCDFAVTTGSTPADRQRYGEALLLELERVCRAGPGALAPPGVEVGLEWPEITSVFVGGGTPTLLDPDDLVSVLGMARAILPLAPEPEVTIEANPETVTEDALRTLVRGGLTRLSLGAQSFSPDVLSTLGRLHRVEAVEEAVSAARAACVPSLSLDLIYGTPGEREEDWQGSLERAVGLGVRHVSCYSLTVEMNTPFGQRVRRGEVAAPDEDVQADRMAVADEVLSAAGLRRYEVSNWAAPGEESLHNLMYWRGGDWLAIGASAHGHWQGRRWWNVRPTARYVEEVLAGRSPVAGEEVLTPDQRRAERLLTGLRTTEGVPRAEVEPLDDAEEARLVAAGLLVDDPDRLRCTAKGLAVADGITARLL